MIAALMTREHPTLVGFTNFAAQTLTLITIERPGRYLSEHCAPSIQGGEPHDNDARQRPPRQVADEPTQLNRSARSHPPIVGSVTPRRRPALVKPCNSR